jgi:hypothetical protein
LKWWNSAFNAQSSRGIIVTVQVGAMKIHVGSNGRGAEDKRKMVKLPQPPWMLMYFLCRFFVCKSNPVYDKTQDSSVEYFLTLQITLLHHKTLCKKGWRWANLHFISTGQWHSSINTPGWLWCSHKVSARTHFYCLCKLTKQWNTSITTDFTRVI